MADITDTFSRTEAGRAEIRAHAVALTRAGRNLLMVIDASCSGAQWLAKVHGSTPADLQQLVEAGLVAARAAGVPSKAAPPAPVRPVAKAQALPPAPATPVAAPAPTAPEPADLAAALEGWSYDKLYSLLTQEAKERFGLIKGYRLVLEIERCANVGELRVVAQRFVEHLRSSHGEDVAARFRQHLITGA